MRASVLLAVTLGLMPACASVKTAAPTKASAEHAARGDRALHSFVDGADQLGRGTASSLTRARALLEESVSLDDKLWEAHYDLGLTLRQLGDLEGARAELMRANELAPKSIEPLWALAECELTRGDPEHAASLLEQFVALEPTRVDARLALAAVERERGRLDQALSTARAVLVRDPRETRALLEIGRIYRVREEYDVAELVLDKARALLLEDEKKSAPVYNELGLLALARGDTQLAFTQFARAESLDPRFVPAHVNQGSVLLRAGDYEGAEKAYRAALHAEAKEGELDAVDARVGLGIAQRGQGKYKEARATYEKVLEAHPSHLAALYDLAVLLADFLNQQKDALPLFERYLASAPKTDSHRESAERYLQDIRMSMGSSP
ncbi:MAG: repeat protein [Myxococcaceae bacterium]|nr:repeat protein [Myxococcaceae bacterium]